MQEGLARRLSHIGYFMVFLFFSHVCKLIMIEIWVVVNLKQLTQTHDTTRRPGDSGTYKSRIITCRIRDLLALHLSKSPLLSTEKSEHAFGDRGTPYIE
jgi:hypothetical protein